MRWVLKGGSADERYPLPAQARDYLLASRFGWTRQQIDEQPAAWLDWMLQLDTVYRQVEGEAHRG